MVEWLQILCMVIGGACFAIGGTGPKWVRRYVMPVLLAAIAVFAGDKPWQALCMALCLVVSLSMGYGERTPFWRKVLVFCSYFASTMWLGFTPWQVFGPIFITIIFYLSNTAATSKMFFWKSCEFIMGSLIGITVAALIG